MLVSFSELLILTQVTVATEVCPGLTLESGWQPVHILLQLYFELAALRTTELEA
jgi:hypothetical protein